MSARSDFLRAMLLGIVIGVAITTAFFQLRGTPSRPPSATNSSSHVTQDAAP